VPALHNSFFEPGFDAGFLNFGVVTLCRSLGVLGDLGWNWVEAGGQGVGWLELPELPKIAKDRRD
jgi:hypothetical protein